MASKISLQDIQTRIQNLQKKGGCSADYEYIGSMLVIGKKTGEWSETDSIYQELMAIVKACAGK